MRSCPHCKRVYPDDARFCAVDGKELISASLVPVASPDDPRLGKRLCGRYELRRVVADGGMGRVYEGIDRELNQRVAVKVLHSEVSRDQVALERFKREYQISSALPHDHIVQVRDFQRDTTENIWLLVMEFLEGEELRLVIKREKRLPPERIVRMLSQLAIGLDGAHDRQYVHRDLKPDNVFLCGSREGDVVKVLDFGSVKDKNREAKKLTVMGTTIGSPYYMAPEQAQGLETLDRRADVFALGAITYEMLCGVVPFSGTNGPQILLSIMTKEPTPLSKKLRELNLPNDVPFEIDTVLEDALAKNPNTRLPSVGALADAFGRALGLTGDHLQWAKISQPDLKAMLAKVVRPQGDPFAVDPFAVPPAQATGAPVLAGPAFGGGGHAASGHVQSVQAAQAMDHAFQATREASFGAGEMELPKKSNWPWIIVAVVVVLLLLAGAVVLYLSQGMRTL
jgi:serine/threonine protein kinase